MQRHGEGRRRGEKRGWWRGNLRLCLVGQGFLVLGGKGYGQKNGGQKDG